MSFPTTTDGKQIVLTSLFPQGVYLYFAGAADDPTAGRGQGIPFLVSTTLATTVNKTFSFNDYVYMSGGKLTWDNAVVGDKVSFGVAAPATTYLPNLAGTGGATLNSSTGLITSTPGTGNIDVVNAVPVPNYTGAGTWAWTSSSWLANPLGDPSPLTGLGQVVGLPAAYDKIANWTYDLYAARVPLATFISNFIIYGTRQTDFTLPAIKPQLVLPQWQITASVTSAGVRVTPLVVSWSLVVARQSTT